MTHFLQIIRSDDIGERLPIDVHIVVLTAIKSVQPPKKQRSDAGRSRRAVQP